MRVEASGSGTFTSTWAELPDGQFYMLAPARYTFGVPESGTLALSLLGAFGFVVFASRKRKS